MQEEAFKQTIILTSIRENLVASALARKGGCSLIFNEDPASRADYDYCLYKPETGFACRIDQQEDYFTTTMDGTLLMELYTLQKDGSKKAGKLNYSKADKILFIINKIKKCLLIDLKVIKNYIIKKELSGDLKILEPDTGWAERNDTLPAQCAILPIADLLLEDQSSKVYNFSELNLPENYDEYQFNRYNND
jgi:hypothetical protein